MKSSGKRKVIVVFGALLVLLIGLVAATMGIGKPSLPDGAIAFVDGVDDGTITPEDFDTAIAQAAARQQGGGAAPEPGTPQYQAQIVPAASDLLLARWVRGEADERGISVTDREIDTELQNIIDQQFGGEKEFQKFLDDSGFSEDDAKGRVELQLLTQCIQDKVIPQDPDNPTPPAREGCQGDETLDISDDDIQKFYDDNIAQFQTPETRDVRTVLNPDEAKAQQAADALTKDDSTESWKDVAKQYSTDEATSDLGGLRQGVARGQNEPALETAIFDAAEGEVVGPVKTQAGYYVLEVEKINAESTQPLDDATKDQIRQSLATQKQQEAVTKFQEDFIAKWSQRTVCSEDLLANDEDGSVQSQLAERCSNFTVSDDGCILDDPGEEPQVDPTTGQPAATPDGCGAFVVAPPVVPPVALPASDDAAAALTTGATPGTALPQGPQPPKQDQAAVPAGALPLGGAGAPGTVQGAPTAPPTTPTAPPTQGAAPTAPPGG